MPTPERTSLDAIIDAGRALLEADGLDGLTMQAVADRVGVRAPSLYKRVRNRDELIARIAEATLQELSERLDDAADPTPGADPGAELARFARAVRAFAHERPAGFRLIFAPGAELRLSDAALADASGAVLRVAGELAGDEHRLDAARTHHGLGERLRQHGARGRVPARRRRRPRVRVRHRTSRGRSDPASAGRGRGTACHFS